MVQPGTAHRQVEESAQVFSWFLTGTEAPQGDCSKKVPPWFSGKGRAGILGYHYENSRKPPGEQMSCWHRQG